MLLNGLGTETSHDSGLSKEVALNFFHPEPASTSQAVLHWDYLRWTFVFVLNLRCWRAASWEPRVKTRQAVAAASLKTCCVPTGFKWEEQRRSSDRNYGQPEVQITRDMLRSSLEVESAGQEQGWRYTGWYKHQVQGPELKGNAYSQWGLRKASCITAPSHMSLLQGWRAVLHQSWLSAQLANPLEGLLVHSGTWHYTKAFCHSVLWITATCPLPT